MLNYFVARESLLLSTKRIEAQLTKLAELIPREGAAAEQLQSIHAEVAHMLGVFEDMRSRQPIEENDK